jgi:alcohol dehydrogenase YqhD (iron-dependent ADH family)
LNGLQAIGLSGDWNVHFIEHCMSAYDDKVTHAEGLLIMKFV